jgi:hypothetical protein
LHFGLGLRPLDVLDSLPAWCNRRLGQRARALKKNPDRGEAKLIPQSPGTEGVLSKFIQELVVGRVTA